MKAGEEMTESSEPTRPIEGSTLEPPPPPPVSEVAASDPGALAPDDVVVVAATERPSTKSVRVLAILVMVAGLILMIAGVVTWFVVRDQLAAEQIVVSDDADRFAGQEVNGPFTAYAQADVINQHALDASGGKTYAQLDQDDPVRSTVMTASFLRASLYTSVVAFGVAFFAFGIGIVMILIGWALMRVERALRAAT
jgi:hypothetical protein